MRGRPVFGWRPQKTRQGADRPTVRRLLQTFEVTRRSVESSFWVAPGRPPAAGGLCNGLSEPQGCLCMLLRLRYCVRRRLLVPATQQMHGLLGGCLPDVNSRGLEMAVKYYPGCGSIKLRRFHLVCTGPYVRSASLPRSGFYCYQPRLEVSMCGLQVMSSASSSLF